MKLNDSIQSLNKVVFSDSVSEEMFTLIFSLTEEFHANILSVSGDQFGNEYSKIYLFFPDKKCKYVVNILANSIIKQMNVFREKLTEEKDNLKLKEENYITKIEI